MQLENLEKDPLFLKIVISLSLSPGLKTSLPHHLLASDQRPSKMGTAYWIDYVHLFGVKEFIPLYDKMEYWRYRNWDVYVIYTILMAFFGYVSFKLLCGCCGLCTKSKK